MRFRPVAILGGLLLIVVGAVYQVKYAVRSLELERQKLERQASELRWELRSLKASWAYLSRPERLARLARKLDLVPGRVDRVVDIGRIGTRAQLEFASRSLAVALPSGNRIVLRPKPLAGLAPRPDRMER